MRFVDGDDLRELVTATGPLAPEHAAAIVAHVADALDAAHDAGLVHRDVKPANILLGAHDQVYLSDFGLASHALSEGGLTSPGGWVGTMDFMAPEQIRGEPVDRRADIYALGCVLHFALTGQAAYPRETDEARLGRTCTPRLPSPRSSCPGCRLRSTRSFAERWRSGRKRVRLGRRARCGGPRGGRAPGGRARQAHGGTPPPAAQRHRRDVARRPASRSAPARPQGRRGDRRPRRRRRRLPPHPRAPQRRTRDRRAAGDHDDRGCARQAARRQGARHPGPARRSRDPRRPRPVNVEVAAGSAWIASTGSPTLDRVPLGGHLRRRGPRLGFGITDITNRRGELWVTVAASRQVVRVRASTGSPIGTPIAMIGQPRAIDAGEGAVWVAEQSPWGADTLVEIDPHTAMVVGRLPVPEGINDVRAANGAVWVLGRHKPVLIKVSAASRQRVVTLPVGRHAERLDVAAGFVWVTDYGDDEVTRVDPKGPKIVKTDVPGRPYGLHARDDGVWVACYGDQSVVRIDPHTGRIVGKPLRVGFNPVAVDVRGHSAWVTSVADDRLTRVDFG